MIDDGQLYNTEEGGKTMRMQSEIIMSMATQEFYGSLRPACEQPVVKPHANNSGADKWRPWREKRSKV